MTFSYHEVGAISPGDTISVPFGFLDRTHISIEVDGIVVGNWEWINNGLIKASAGFPIGTKTKVYRTTPLTALPSTLQGASVFDWEGVNLNDLQALFVLQEYVDKEVERNASIEFIKDIAEALAASMEDLAETILPALSLKADIESPALTGSPTTPTPATDAPDFVIANMEAVRRAFNAITKASLGLGSVDNVSAANLRDRTTHTGQQAMGTVSGLVDALALKASHTDVAEAVAGVVNSSPAALDTLRELATALGDDPNFSATVSTALGNRLRVDLAQSLTTTQKNQAAANLGIAPGATANATDAALRARSSHTGTQSADTITDSATKVVMTSTERAKLGAVAEGATANDSDANLKNRANHTGTQGVDTISGIGEWVEDRVAGLIKAGPNITVTYNDAGNELTIGASGTVSTSAGATTFTPAGGIASTNVQAALQEVDTSNIRDRGTLASGADLDTVTSPGTYQISSNALASSILNSPSTQAGQLLVYYTGASVQVTQQYIVWGGAAGGGRIFTRTKHVTLGWSAWAGSALQSEIDGKLDKTGGILTGATTIRSTSATFLLDSTALGSSNLIWGRKNSVSRWALIPGNSTAEAGDGSGSDFALHRYNDAGSFLDVAWRVDRKDGFTISQNGHKWTRGIDISGQSLDALVVAGRYAGNNLTNTPYVSSSYWYVDVDVWQVVGSTSNVRQVACFVGGGPVTVAWERRRQNSVWGLWTPVGGFVSPEHYNALGDGVNDDSSAVELALRSGFPVLLRGYYRITRQITFGQGYATAVYIQGQGKRHFFLDSNAAGLTFNTGTAGTTGSNRQIVARDFIGICNSSAHTEALLKVNGGAGSGSTEKTFDIRNVHSFGADGTKGTLYGIWLHNGRNGVIDGTVHQGKRNGVPGSMEGAGVYLTGSEDPVGINITNWKAYFTQAGVSVQDTHEGIEISSGEAVMVDYGVLADLDETTPSGPDDGKPLLKVTNNHFNVHVAGVHMTDVRDFNIANNDFLFQGAGEKIGIWSEARSSSTLYGDISGNKFDGANSTGPVTGLWFQGYSGGGVMGVHVGVNRYVLLARGLYIGDHARGITFSGASHYAAVGTPVYWAASTSSISRYGVPVAV